MPEPIKIDIWSDIACPWCYIGKRKLESAMTTYAMSEDAIPVEIEYHSFELSPDTPEDYDGTVYDFLMAAKGASREQVEGMLSDVTARAARVGLAFHYDRHVHANTVKALQLLHYAKEHGVQLEMSERLFEAHFTEGKHIGKVDVLAELASQVGLDGGEVVRALQSDQFLRHVRDDVDEARRLGIQGVPFYVFEGRYGVSGAQEPAVFERVLRQVQDERSKALA